MSPRAPIYKQKLKTLHYINEYFDKKKTWNLHYIKEYFDRFFQKMEDYFDLV